MSFRNGAERRAARWYRLHGYRLLDTNAWVAGNELDLVAGRGRMLVFCEVKSKGGGGYGDPLEMITPEKVRRVKRAAEAWLGIHPQYGNRLVRFDVVVVRDGLLEHLEGAFS